jgi:hypothetical protein
MAVTLHTFISGRKKTIQALDVPVSKKSGGNLIPHEKYR